MKRIVAQITLTTAADGSTTTFYYTNGRGFRTRPTDTPPNKWVEPRVKSFGKLRRELFKGGYVTGAVRPSGATMYLHNEDGGLDPWRGYGTSGGQVIYWMGDDGAAFPASYEAVQIMYLQAFRMPTLNEVLVEMRDRSYLLDKPMVTASFAGTGGLEGTGVASKRKQWASGDPGFFPIIIVNVVSQIYFVQEPGPGTLAADCALFEGGVEVTRGADYASEAELLGTAPTSGQCRFWFGPAGAGPIYVRMGTPPVLELRVFSQGYQADGSQWSFSALCRRAGMDDVTGEIGYVGARLVDDESTYLQVMEAACVKYQQFFGFDRLDQFRSEMLLEPEASESVHTFTYDNCKKDSFRRDPVNGMEAPAYQVTFNFGKTWPCTFASGAPDEMKDFLSRNPWWTSFSGSSAATKLANPGALSVELSSANRDIQNSFQQSNAIARFLGLFSGQRDFLTCTVEDFDTEILRIELHDTITIEIPRLGCDDGLVFRVVVIEIDWDAREITFTNWGGDAGDTGTIDDGDPDGTGITDPIAIQTELGVDLLTELSEVILIESDVDYLLCEDDAPILAENNLAMALE